MIVVPIPSDALRVPPLPDTQALTTKTFKKPPLDGSLSIPEVYDWHYVNSPEHPLFVYSDSQGEVKSILWPEAVRGVHTAARIVQARVSVAKQEGVPRIVGILAASDTISSFTLIIGVMRAGFVPFLVSPRNSAVAVAHLLADTGTCHILLGHDQPIQDLASEALNILRNDSKYKTLPALPDVSLVPLFDDIYRPVDEPFELLPPSKPDPRSLAVIVHSSGSTAFPKPIPWTHLGFLMYSVVPYFGGRDMTRVKLSCHAIPMFHVMGVMQTGWTATAGLTITAAKPRSPTIPLTSDNVIEGVLHTKADFVFCPPFFAETWSKDPARIQQLKTQVQGIVYSGGPLNKEAGDRLMREGIHVFVVYGSSEVGIISRALPSAPCVDWEYFKITKQLRPIFQANGSGQFELVVVPSPYERPYVVNGKVDGQDAYFTNDLLEPHPTLPEYWKVYGRSDDQIMHNTGEKTNPGPLESIMNQDPRVRSSVMFGRGRFNTGMIIDVAEPYVFDPDDIEALSKFRNAIWPTVERLNKYAPQHSRLFKEMILVAHPAKPFQYTPKNVPRRQVVLNLYEPEISALYQAVEESTQMDIPPPENWSYDSTVQFVQSCVRKVLNNGELEDDEDLFQAGADSLQATWIRNTLLRGMRDSAKIDTNAVPHNIVFEKPTISSLSLFASRFVSMSLSGTGTFSSTFSATEEDKVQNMLDLVAKYTQSFPARYPTRSRVIPRTNVVLLTGTTGGLGARLLAELVACSTVSKIWAVNRKQRRPLWERQRASLVKQGLDVSVMESEKVVLVEADVSEENVGLGEATLDEIRSAVTHMIHNAWRVDFNLSLSSFESNIRGLRQLIDLALSSKLPAPPRILYASSISVVGCTSSLSLIDDTGMNLWESMDRHDTIHSDLDAANVSDEPVAEEPLDASVATTNGYSQSKWVSETILLKAREVTPLRPVIVRIGQISGGRPNGYWNETDWVPAMVKSSLTMGCFPTGKQMISWVPLDLASRVIVDLRDSTSSIVHLVHPKPISWSDFARTVSSELQVPLVPYSEWLRLLEERTLSPDNDSGAEEALPAAKILSFFRQAASGMEELQDGKEAMGLATLDISRAMSESVTMRDDREMRTIRVEEVKLWLENWIRQGYLELRVWNVEAGEVPRLTS